MEIRVDRIRLMRVSRLDSDIAISGIVVEEREDTSANDPSIFFQQVVES